MIIKTIDTVSELQNEFISYDRDYYTYEGYQAILDYFEDFGDTYELDVIAICCDFNESTIEDIRNDYNIDDDTEVIDYLNDNTYAVETVDDNILYISF